MLPRLHPVLPHHPPTYPPPIQQMLQVLQLPHQHIMCNICIAHM